MKNIIDFFSKLSFNGINNAKANRTAILNSIFGDDKLHYEKIIAISDLHKSGQVYLLSLVNIKQALGVKWYKHYNDILKSLVKNVRDKIDENDVFYARSDDEFIIIFTEKNELVSQHICIEILQNISKIYIGKHDNENIIINVATGRLNGKLLFKRILTTDLKEEKRFSISNFNLSQKINDQIPLATKKKPYELVYKPIWDRKKELISTYMVNARRTDDININNSTTTPIGYDVLSNPFSLSSRMEMDIFMMQETIVVMNDFFKNKFRAIFSIPVHHITLFNLTRLNKFIYQCQAIPKHLRKYISFTLIGFPEGFPEARMNFIITNLLKFSRNVVINCDKIPQNISYFKNNQISGLALTIPSKIDNPNLYWDKINQLSTHCQKEKISLYLDGINDFNDLSFKKETDLDFISGNIIGSYTDVPANISHKNWDDILTSKVKN